MIQSSLDGFELKNSFFYFRKLHCSLRQSSHHLLSRDVKPQRNCILGSCAMASSDVTMGLNRLAPVVTRRKTLNFGSRYHGNGMESNEIFCTTWLVDDTCIHIWHLFHIFQKSPMMTSRSLSLLFNGLEEMLPVTRAQGNDWKQSKSSVFRTLKDA